MTPNKLALLLGALPSDLALEELPATQRELDLFPVMRLTEKEQSCSHTCSPSHSYEGREGNGDLQTTGDDRKHKHTISSPLCGIFPTGQASAGGGAAALTAPLGGEQGDSATAPWAAVRKDRGIWKSSPRITPFLLKLASNGLL